jgi:hypothetical protein
MTYELTEERKQYIAACKDLRLRQKLLRQKHSSKVYKGFCKMCLRQDNKPQSVIVQLPRYYKLPLNIKGEYIHEITFNNNRWNGMNLKVLCNQVFYRVGYFKSPFHVHPITGKYSLTMNGKRKLEKLKSFK